MIDWRARLADGGIVAFEDNNTRFSRRQRRSGIGDRGPTRDDRLRYPRLPGPRGDERAADGVREEPA